MVEILVALAIGSIVLTALGMLVVQGVNNYRKQTITASIQSEANITMNQIADSAMEAATLNISNNSGVTEYIQIKDDLYYIYDGAGQTLYQAKQLETANRSILCENVTKFNVMVIETSLEIDENDFVTAIDNPVQIKITIELERASVSRQVDREITIRNNMSDIFIQSGDNSYSILNNSTDSLSEYVITGQ